MKCLSFRCDYWFGRKLHVRRLQDGVLLEDVLLGLVMTKGLESKQTSVTDHKRNAQTIINYSL